MKTTYDVEYDRATHRTIIPGWITYSSLIPSKKDAIKLATDIKSRISDDHVVRVVAVQTKRKTIKTY